MQTQQVTMVRIYCTEGQGHLKEILARLHDEYRVRGVTAFRGIAGFGSSGTVHGASLLDVSLDLPLVIEFFDEPARVAEILEEIASLYKPGHVVSWTATINA